MPTMRSCHTHTQIRRRLSEAVTHTKPLFIYAQRWCFHLNISCILFHSNFTTTFPARNLRLKYSGSEIRLCDVETNASDSSLYEIQGSKWLPSCYGSGFQLCTNKCSASDEYLTTKNCFYSPPLCCCWLQKERRKYDHPETWNNTETGEEPSDTKMTETIAEKLRGRIWNTAGLKLGGQASFF